MKLKAIVAFSLAIVGINAIAPAQPAVPAPTTNRQASQFQTSTYTPTDEEFASLKAKLVELNGEIDALKKAGADSDLIVDAESCAWQADNMIGVPGAFMDQTYVGKTTTLLNDGLRRAGQIKAGTATWPAIRGRNVNLGYRSAVDGTAQSCHLMVPASYDPAKPIPLYVYLHGRSHIDPDLGEGWAGGNDSAGGGRGGGGGNSYIRLEAFGRANNSYLWAGETDVLEAIASVRHRFNIDPNRILLSGFSLGGAGSWQLGLHCPDLFCGLEIDAGVLGNRTSMEGMTAVQRAAQSPYGIMIDHAINVFNVPLVAYAGANDAQLASSTAMRKQLTDAGYTIEQTSQYVGKGKDINVLFLANPGQGHSHATGATKQLVDDFDAESMKNGRIVPDHIKFVTYTTRYNRDFWITVDGMGANFSRAFVDAQRDAGKSNFTIKTENVSRLIVDSVTSPFTIDIDGDTVKGLTSRGLVIVEKDPTNGGHWKMGTWRIRTASQDGERIDPTGDQGLRKRHGLQGPVNDAFMTSFLCVTPSGQPFSHATDAATKQELKRFAAMFKRDYLGDARTRADTAVTDDDIANNNLILFGDPGSNSLIAKIADELPIRWTKGGITVGDKTYDVADTLPVLIYPNPLNPRHYVVINTGQTAGGRGGGTAYGDWAVLKVTTKTDGQGATVVADAGVFNEEWKFVAP